MNLAKNKLIIYAAIVAFLGFLDASFLTIEHFKNSIPPCTAGGCEAVLTSKYAVILGVPMALLGSLFYLSVIILCLLILTNHKKIFLKAFYLLAAWGFVFSMFLLGLQAFVIHAYCQYCLLSVATSTGIAILAFLNYRKPLTIEK